MTLESFAAAAPRLREVPEAVKTSLLFVVSTCLILAALAWAWL